MGARQYSLWLWLCQITTCLHEFETWNHAAWFVCVPYQMHNASRPWIIYINKWRKSVWFTANTLLFYFHLKGIFFSFAKKDPPKTKQSSILERQMADRVNLSLLSKITVWWNAWLPWKFRKMEQFVGLLWENMVVSWRTHIKSFTSVNICVLFWNTYLYIIYFIFSCIALFYISPLQ